MFTAAKDGSFTIDGLRQTRAQGACAADRAERCVAGGYRRRVLKSVIIKMTPATGWKLEKQRPADSCLWHAEI